MGLNKIKKGLDLPINGSPKQEVSQGKNPRRVAVIGDDYVGMKPTMLVQVGEQVKLGQPLFSDKKMPKVQYTAPASGKVVEINRGLKRHFQSLVIEVDGGEEITFKSTKAAELDAVSREDAITLLLESGLWSSLRVRPFSKVANPDENPSAIFITAMDTNPLAPKVSKILEGRETDFENGIKVISKLTDGKVFLCKAPDESIKAPSLSNVVVEEFSGPHPAGLAGTHIHFLAPVSSEKKVFYISAQDVAQIGYLFTTGKINTERIVALCGPSATNARLLKVQMGTSVSEILDGEFQGEKVRAVTGSVLNGRTAAGPYDYLGRFHQQITLLAEGDEREFLGWLIPSSKLHSVKNILLSNLIPGKKFDLTTTMNGGKRAIVPVGSYEKVMPLDILPTYLLRALAVDDVEEAEKLGCLELDEEDLALCTYVCPSKINHGEVLRRNLTLIEKEG